MRTWNSSYITYVPSYATSATSTVYVQPSYAQAPIEPAPPRAPKPETELAWLRRRVSEITDLVAA